MSGLAEHASEYLRMRRGLGFKLERHGQLLPQFIAYLEAAGASTVTRELAISWAKLPVAAHPKHWAARLSIARGFAVYLQTLDPDTEVPPADVFAVRYQRRTPYLWSPLDISRLLHAAGRLRPGLRAASYETLFGLLAVTGMRVGEAVALDVDDVDLDDGVITIREQVAKLEPRTAGPAAPDHGANARPIPHHTSAAGAATEHQSVLPLGDRHGESNAARSVKTLRASHDRPRTPDRERCIRARTISDIASL